MKYLRTSISISTLEQRLEGKKPNCNLLKDNKNTSNHSGIYESIMGINEAKNQSSKKTGETIGRGVSDYRGHCQI